MKRESLVFLISGTVFGLFIGWLIGSQQGVPTPPPPPAATAAAPASQPAPAEPPAPPLDAQHAAALEKDAVARPTDEAVRVELANLYFNAEQFALAIPWYEAALKLKPRDVNASTDLGVSYYYTQQDDRALAQFDRSLAIDPNHVKTLFNQGIVRASGKRDLQGALASWKRVIEIAPDSEEGRRSKQIMDDLKQGHAGVGGGAAPADGSSAKGAS